MAEKEDLTKAGEHSAANADILPAIPVSCPPDEVPRAALFSKSEKLLFYAAVIMWLVPVPSGAVWLVIRMAAATGALIQPVLHIPWIRHAKSKQTRLDLSFLFVSMLIVASAGYTWHQWPPVKRHTFSEREKRAFERPLKTAQGPIKSVAFSCPLDDEKACQYAHNLIPLFVEAGWDADNVITRGIQQTPMEGIVLVQHAVADPKNPHDPKYATWEKILHEELDVRQAFVNVGVEPSWAQGKAAEEGKITIYVGPERDDESTPTDLTQTVEDIRKAKRSGQIKKSDYPEVQ